MPRILNRIPHYSPNRRRPGHNALHVSPTQDNRFLERPGALIPLLESPESESSGDGFLEYLCKGSVAGSDTSSTKYHSCQTFDNTAITSQGGISWTSSASSNDDSADIGAKKNDSSIPSLTESACSTPNSSPAYSVDYRIDSPVPRDLDARSDFFRTPTQGTELTCCQKFSFVSKENKYNKMRPRAQSPSIGGGDWGQFVDVSCGHI
mmetsp:Transcript_24403/g.48599  ORF Transcript_24403/g.48599 Transcript_24403/m.48599 type:complete len:207 (+) Transcript_24403:86-706(+)|eukprot:CAMPEP_0194309302 /NCGR_PEP_ID=MMETSP0171-20130528/6284_1 /TAXON_ID=218684 /ORGANISM="Corethron pennatum, Strain L29A3" /LENGTH=206 /DNA_ID=CAMNT_0039062421 /DNA_START=85 /DNA_END=705 /DNA_ORIENTATION=-